VSVKSALTYLILKEIIMKVFDRVAMVVAMALSKVMSNSTPVVTSSDWGGYNGCVGDRYSHKSRSFKGNKRKGL